jgi:hypothetical protein
LQPENGQNSWLEYLRQAVVDFPAPARSTSIDIEEEVDILEKLYLEVICQRLEQWRREVIIEGISRS